jgi:hypothetical protein
MGIIVRSRATDAAKIAAGKPTISTAKLPTAATPPVRKPVTLPVKNPGVRINQTVTKLGGVTVWVEPTPAPNAGRASPTVSETLGSSAASWAPLNVQEMGIGAGLGAALAAGAAALVALIPAAGSGAAISAAGGSGAVVAGAGAAGAGAAGAGAATTGLIVGGSTTAAILGTQAIKTAGTVGIGAMALDALKNPMVVIAVGGIAAMLLLRKK